MAWCWPGSPAVLGGVVIFAALKLIDLAAFRRIRRVRRSELMLALVTTASSAMFRGAVRTCSTVRPMSRQTLAATVPLSPVMISTAMPSWFSLAIEAPASALAPVDEGDEAGEAQVALVSRSR